MIEMEKSEIVDILKPYFRALKNDDYVIRMNAIKSLSSSLKMCPFYKDVVVPELIKSIFDKEESVRYFALQQVHDVLNYRPGLRDIFFVRLSRAL